MMAKPKNGKKAPIKTKPQAKALKDNEVENVSGGLSTIKLGSAIKIR